MNRLFQDLPPVPDEFCMNGIPVTGICAPSAKETLRMGHQPVLGIQVVGDREIYQAYGFAFPASVAVFHVDYRDQS